MSVHISVQPHPAPAEKWPAGVFELRRYGDPFMVKYMGLDTAFIGTSNFQNIALFTPALGFGGVTQFQFVDYHYLMSLQRPDNFTLAQKMGWLTGTGRPYWWKDSRYVFGTILFGGQLCRVEVDSANRPVTYTFEGRYQQESGSKHAVEFYKLRGIRLSEMSTYTHETAPWYIQKCSCAYRTPVENIYRDVSPKGTVYHPVWSPLDFPTNNGDRDLYVAKDFLIL